MSRKRCPCPEFGQEDAAPCQYCENYDPDSKAKWVLNRKAKREPRHRGKEK